MKLRSLITCLFCPLLAATPAFANPPGGSNGTDANVTLVNNNNGTVTMGNGIVSILCTTAGATINQINYTYDNGDGPTTTQLLNGGTDGGMLYWELGNFGSGNFAYSVVADPANNGGNYGEIDLLTTSTTNGTVDIHFSMLRGSTGFYVTAIWNHRNGDLAMGLGETRDNIYAGSIFDWMSVDAARNKLMEVSGGSAIGVLNAPVEVSLWTNGIYQGQYEDKYKYSADFGEQRVWGWSSVTAGGYGGLNVGLWNVTASGEYFSGGPMKRELMCHIGTTILNMLNGSHYGGGTDTGFAANEIWTKVYGPYFIYCNNVSNSIIDPIQASQALYADAQAQGAAEATAWPYSWFANANYAPAANRGVIAGQMVINDVFNPNASAAGLWVGAVRSPATIHNDYDFQEWTKPYQFWVKTDTNGNFAISNVIAGNNYTLYAFGPGAAGTFQSQALPNPVNELDIASPPFNVNVTGGETNNLGAVIWTPKRVGPTVFEIGCPDRNTSEFRHGDNFWVSDLGPSPDAPSPIWGKYLEYPFDFPNGPNYTVGQSRWSTDWNYVQPVITDSQGNFDDSTSTINFTLAQAPAKNAQASLYIALASDYQGPLIVSVNTTNLGTAPGVISSPSAESVNGYSPNDSNSTNESDTTIREGRHGIFSDNRITFTNLLHQGANTITINMRKGGYFANHAMYDYIRLELSGYVPPPPASVTAYAGNNCNLVCWPVTPGACSYNVLSTTTLGSGYNTIATNVIGPVCGSGSNNTVYLDTNAVNGTAYFYVVQAVNTIGTSTNSPESIGATPADAVSTNAPPAPTGLAATTGHGSVALTWNASTGANFYTIQRSTLVNNGGGGSNTLSLITLNNGTTDTRFTDASTTDGTPYNYFVSATSAGGNSGNSTPFTAITLPSPPASAPGSFSGAASQGTNIILNWSAVPDAVGYIVERASSAAGPYTFLMSVTETTYADIGLALNGTNYYHVLAVNAGGTSANAAATVLTGPSTPSLSAVPSDTKIILSWSAVPAATNYFLLRSTSTNGPFINILTTNSTGFTDTGLTDGSNYYYEVYSQGPNGRSPFSAIVGATPFVAGSGILWIDPVTSSAQSWNVNSNWSNGSGFPNGTQTAAIINISITGNQTIDLNQAITAGSLSIGASSGGASFIIAANGGTLTLDNSPGTATILQLPTSKGDTISAPMVINTLNVTNLSANAINLSGNISGAGGSLTLNGNVMMSGVNSYSGGTMVNSGRLTFGAGSAIPASGTLAINSNAAVTVSTANGLPNVLVNGTNTITGQGNSGTGIGMLNDAGALTLAINTSSGTSKVFDLTGAMSGSGSLTLGSNVASLRFNGTAGDGAATFNLGSGTAVANVRNTGTTAIALGGLTGGSGTQLQGDNSSGGVNMTYTIGGANGNTEFDGLIVNGSVGTVALTKTGSGTLTLIGANTYSAGTTINDGTLLVNNTTGSGTGSGAVTVAANGRLSGTGIISGAVTVNSGGTLAPGNGLGALTMSNKLTLASGSTTVMQARHLPLTNSLAKVGGPLSEGGTLTVTNGSTAAFTAGDHFTLFNAAGYTGAFAGYNLPLLNSVLAWNTTRLGVDGSLWVVSTAPPVINHPALSLASGNLILSGSSGTPNWFYYVLSTTNVTLPFSQWTRIATNTFDASGNFSFTNAINTNQPQTYLGIQQE